MPITSASNDVTHLGLTLLGEALVPLDVLVVSQVVVSVRHPRNKPPRSAIISIAVCTEQSTNTSFVKAQRCSLPRHAVALSILLHNVADAVIIDQQTAAGCRAISWDRKGSSHFIVVADQRLRGDESREKTKVHGEVGEHNDELLVLNCVILLSPAVISAPMITERTRSYSRTIPIHRLCCSSKSFFI